MAAQWRTGDGAPYRGGCVSDAREGGDALPYIMLAPNTSDSPPGMVTGRLTLFNCQREGSLCQRRRAAFCLYNAQNLLPAGLGRHILLIFS